MTSKGVVMKIKNNLLLLSSLVLGSVAMAQNSATVPGVGATTGKTDIPTAPITNTAPSNTGTTAVPPESSGAIQDQTTGTYISPNAPNASDSNRQIPHSKRTSRNNNGTTKTDEDRSRNSDQHRDMNNNSTYPETDRQ